MKKALSIINVFILMFLLFTQPFISFAKIDRTDEILKIITTDLSENEYGGSYIENGVVHLWAIKNDTPKAYINQLSKMGCVIEYASYSLSYLKKAMTEITEIAKGCESVTIELNDKKNSIIVSIFGEDDTKRLSSILQKKDFFNAIVIDSLLTPISFEGTTINEQSMAVTYNVFAGTYVSSNFSLFFPKYDPKADQMCGKGQCPADRIRQIETLQGMHVLKDCKNPDNAEKTCSRQGHKHWHNAVAHASYGSDDHVHHAAKAIGGTDHAQSQYAIRNGLRIVRV